ncbi:hypothetical protein [Actinomyces bowdenii]|uniref:Uncharacterized protein n=1 Tax=Actinomyces bowdenii TaxID=131109 RepID=A0A853EJL6_9ACTO|nr:hypothetical protein [Actinomyces bowdenii]MBF0697181.1 hypothetical protein [Actinomyces bowdenii]NYS69354.1 hypothetical protein [Actinomyces bowdenii]
MPVAPDRCPAPTDDDPLAGVGPRPQAARLLAAGRILGALAQTSGRGV